MLDPIPVNLKRSMIRVVEQAARDDAFRHIAVGLMNHRGIIPPGTGPDLQEALLAGQEPDAIPAPTLCDVVANQDEQASIYLLHNVYEDAYFEVTFDLITQLEAQRAH